MVTAAHCISEVISLDTVISDHNDTSIAQVSANKTVIIGNINKHNGVRISVSKVNVHPTYVYKELAQHNIDLGTWYNQTFEEPYGIDNKPSYKGDIAVLELATEFSQQTASALVTTELFRNIDNQKKSMSIYGWGKTETGEMPNDMRKTDILLDIEYPYIFDIIGSENPDLTDNNVDYSNYDLSYFYPSESGSQSDVGDSGSPVIVDGKTHSFVSANLRSTSITTRTAAYIDWLATQINAVNTVGSLSVEFEQTSTVSKTWTFPVQNLTTSDISFTPYLDDQSGLFNLDSSTCEGVFATGEDCEITISFNINNAEFNEDINSTLLLNDSKSIELNVKDIYVDPTAPIVDEKVEEVKSGGSSGVIVLIIAVVGFMRGRFN